jgi:hypothetical protein
MTECQLPLPAETGGTVVADPPGYVREMSLISRGVSG